MESGNVSPEAYVTLASGIRQILPNSESQKFLTNSQLLLWPTT